MHIPSNTRMHRYSKDPSPPSSSRGSSLSTSSTSSQSTISSISYHLQTLQKLDLDLNSEFLLKDLLFSGQYSKVHLATFRSRSSSRSTSDPGDPITIKSTSKNVTSAEDFNREVALTYFLSPHPNIVTCYNTTFLWSDYSFLLEYAPFGDLLTFLSASKPPGNAKFKSKSPEPLAKLIAQQLSSALEFMHSLSLVHSQVDPSNILVFNPNLFKLSDFGHTYKEGTLIVLKQRSRSIFTPPEICDLLPQEKYHVSCKQDCWQLGVLIYFLMSGKGPWTRAEGLGDKEYKKYGDWLRRKSVKVPEGLKPYSLRFRRLFKRMVEPKVGNRKGVREVRKYLKDEWLAKNKGSKVNTLVKS